VYKHCTDLQISFKQIIKLLLSCLFTWKNLHKKTSTINLDLKLLDCSHGRRQLGGRGRAPWIFIHGTNIAGRGLKVLFFGLFCYFSVFFSVALPSGNFSADALDCSIVM